MLCADVNSASYWGDNLKYDFPLTITADQLVENSGDPDSVDDSDNTYCYSVYNDSYRWLWYFEFNENGQLETVNSLADKLLLSDFDSIGLYSKSIIGLLLGYFTLNSRAYNIIPLWLHAWISIISSST
ncbi:MAG: hypothetical protein K5745_01660, partial [Saccharofermentans sp.]|nr:hypothetical protein [Saccharofermentans sp.]